MLITDILKSAIKDRLEARKPRVQDTRPKAALVFGAGALPGIGAAVAQRVAEGGLTVYVTGRNLEKLQASVSVIEAAGGKAKAVQVDASDRDQVDAAFAQVDADGFCLDLVVHNVGTNRPGGFLDIKPEHLEKSWRADCLSGFYVGQAAVKVFQPRGEGTLIFTGASASMRGKAMFAQFASVKAGLRAVAQSMAREFGPKGIHVAHVVVDGMVDGNRLRTLAPAWLEQQGEQGALDPAAIAQSYWQLYKQHKTAWTHELDLRPFKENW